MDFFSLSPVHSIRLMQTVYEIPKRNSTLLKTAPIFSSNQPVPDKYPRINISRTFPFAFEKKKSGLEVERRKFSGGEFANSGVQIDFLLALDQRREFNRRLKWARRNPNFLLVLSLSLSPPSSSPVTRLNQPDPRASLVHTLIRDSAEQLIKFIRIALDYAAPSSLVELIVATDGNLTITSPPLLWSTSLGESWKAERGKGQKSHRDNSREQFERTAPFQV